MSWQELLSGERNVSILTVKKAYDELEKEGFIVIRQGLGTFVAPLSSELIREEKQKEMEEHLLRVCQIAKSIDLYGIIKKSDDGNYSQSNVCLDFFGLSVYGAWHRVDSYKLSNKMYSEKDF